MSRAEVEAILGPPGDYTTGPTGVAPVLTTGLFVPDCFAILFKRGPSVPEWKSDTVIINLEFDDAGRVQERCHREVFYHEADPLSKLLWRAKRQWQRWFP
jgi:hypothetical protein